ncbi:DDE transposase [Clostridia bacterium]|nr:DDE transposase [Clostridia bacterium]
MEKSRTPLTKWFLAIYLMGQDKRGCSALKLKRELQIAYDTAWTISHKIRKAMGERDSLYMLSGTVEADDSFFGAAHEGSNRGRGTDKTPVVFGLSLDCKGRSGYLRAKVCTEIDGDILTDFAKSCIVSGSLIRSDGLTAYKRLSKEGFLHEAEVFNHKENPEHLKWLHTLISNAKSFIAGTYHGLDNVHLQAFLDEFCYRFNRRYWLDQIFARTIKACVVAKPFTRYALIG